MNDLHLEAVKNYPTLKDKRLYSESRSSIWLANGNEYAKKGNGRLAKICYDKSQYWLDRANKSRWLADTLIG